MKLDDYLLKAGPEGLKASLEDSLRFSDYLLSRIQKKIHPTQLSAETTPMLSFLATLPEEEALLFLRVKVKEHFNGKEGGLKISGADVDQLFKRIKKIKKENQVNPAKPEPSSGELEKELEQEKQRITAHPAQDFKYGKMFFTVRMKSGKVLVTSEKELLTFIKAEEQGIFVDPKTTDVSRFSPEGVLEFVRGKVSVSPLEIFKSIKSYLKKYIVFQDDKQATLLTLWIIGTYCFKIFRYYPYIWITAPKRSGKTLSIEVMVPISFNGEHLINITMAVVFRDVHSNLVTLYIDEAEKFTKADKESRGEFISLLNSGFSDAGEVKRTAKDKKGNFFIERFSSYSPKCLAGISQIDSVLQDRVIKIQMVRKKEDEVVDRYKRSDELLVFQSKTRDSLYQFALTFATDIARRYNEKVGVRGLKHLSNRDLDIWEPIFTLANLIDDRSGGQSCLTAEMEDFSAKNIKLKSRDDVEQDELTKILVVLNNLLIDKKPLLLNSGDHAYYANDMLQYFNKSKELGFISSQNRLTHLLKQANITSAQRRFKGVLDRQRVYIFNLQDLKGTIERYGL